MVPYAASKGGIAMLTRGMAVALAHYGIRVLAVAPGTIRTPNTESSLRTDSTLSRILSRTPMGRIGMPADIAGVVAFLASPDAGYMTGTTVYVDGGRLALGHVRAQRPLARMVGSSDSTHGVRRSGSPRR
jgi:glucose 1-dehydrogenase